MKTTKKTSFSLIELLVVIGIIALLAGILLPSLGRSRESALRSKCLSNLKQLAAAGLMYSNDSNDYLPHAVNISGYTVHGIKWGFASWKAQIISYSSYPLEVETGQAVRQRFQSEIFLCPSWMVENMRQSGVADDLNYDTGLVAQSGGGYGYNYGDESLGYFCKTKTKNTLPAKIGECTMPSETIMIGESSDRQSNGNEAVLIYTKSQDWIDGRHYNYSDMPIVWVDGHASSMKNTQIYTGKVRTTADTNQKDYYFAVKK